MKADKDHPPLNNISHDTLTLRVLGTLVVLAASELIYSQWAELKKLGNDTLTNAHKSSLKTTYAVYTSLTEEKLAA